MSLFHKYIRQISKFVFKCVVKGLIELDPWKRLSVNYMHHLITSSKTLYSVLTAYATFDRYSTHILFPKYPPHAIHTSTIIFSTACPKQSIRIISALFNASPCLRHAFTTRTRGHHLDTFRTLIISTTLPVINLLTLTPPPLFLSFFSCALQSWSYCYT